MNHHILNINILDHPTNRNLTVYFYTEERHSEYFKVLLREQNIAFEFQYDEEEMKYYFGISKSNEKESKRLNYLVFAKFRKPFIDNAIGKYVLLGVTLLFIILALIGYLKS